MAASSHYPPRPPLAAAFNALVRRADLRRGDTPEASLLGSQIGAVSPGELAEAIETSGIGRVFVLAPRQGTSSAAALDLARALTARGKRSALASMKPDAAQGFGVSAGASGLLDVAQGRSGFGAVLHRDPYSYTHLVPSAGFDPVRAEPAAAGTAALFLDALRVTYGSTVVDYPVAGLGSLATYFDADSALVLAMPDGEAPLPRPVLLELRRHGFGDVVLMCCAPADLSS